VELPESRYTDAGIRRCFGTIYLKRKREKIKGLIQRPSMRQLTAIAAFVGSIGAVRVSVTHIIHVDAVSTLALELRIRTIRNSPDSRQERRRLRRAQGRKLIRTVRTIRQTVADPGRVDEFQFTRTTENSSMFARRASFFILTKHAVEFTVAPDKQD